MSVIWDQWLIKQNIIQNAEFTQYVFLEDNQFRNQVEDELIDLIQTYHRNLIAPISILSKHGYPLLEKELRSTLLSPLPQTDKTVKGNFGEILACNFANVCLGFDIPVFRLRHNPNYDQSMKGDDVLGFIRNLNGEIEKIIVGESKFRSSISPSQIMTPLSEAYESLAKGPKSLDYLCAMLDLNGQFDYARSIRQIKNKISQSQPHPLSITHNLILLLTSGRSTEPFISLKNKSPLLPNLNAVYISLDLDFQSWLKQIFNKANE